MRAFRTFLVVTPLVLAAYAACSPPENSSDTVDGLGSAGSAASGSGASGSGSTGAGAAASTDGSAGGGLAFIGTIPTTADSGLNGCVADSKKAEVITKQVTIDKPAAFYIMLDKSGSMNDSCCSGTSTKWKELQAAVTAFVQDPNSAGIKVAVNYFSGSSCPSYATPMVPMGELPGNAQPVIDSLATVSPGGLTPTAAALQGIIDFCATYVAQVPADNCVGVLMTDGDPTACSPSDGPGLAAMADAAFQARQQQTFTVGMEGATFSLLDTVAKGGHGDCTPNDGNPDNFACDASSGRAAFIAALQQIRQSVVVSQTIQTTIPCEWMIPADSSGQTVDPTKVNLQFSQGSSPPQVIGNVADASQCRPTVAAWYYDPADTHHILVCPDTCTVIQSVTDVQVDLLIGCETQPAIPPA